MENHQQRNGFSGGNVLRGVKEGGLLGAVQAAGDAHFPSRPEQEGGREKEKGA